MCACLRVYFVHVDQKEWGRTMLNRTRRSTDVHRHFLLIAICIGIDLLGRGVAVKMNLPIWLDMVGTCIAAYYTGMVGGVITGIMNNVIIGIGNPIAMLYSITSIMAAITVSMCAKRGDFEEWYKVGISSFWLGIVCVCVSTPINLIVGEGYSGNMWGDALFDMLAWYGWPKIFCAFAGETVVEVIDKQICVLLTYLVIKYLNRLSLKQKKAKKLAWLFPMLLTAICQIYIFQETTYARAEEEEQLAVNNYVATIYNNRSGMMSSEANAIAQTEDGFIWIGSYAGLTRYDGTNFEFIKESGIASVTCMMNDQKGRLWIGTNDGGVIRYEHGQFTHFTMADGLPVNSIRAFTEDAKGNVYVATTDRVCQFNVHDQIEILSVPLTYVESMVVVGDVLVTVDNNGKLNALKEGRLLAKEKALEEDEFFNCLCMTSKGLLAGASGKVLYTLEINDKAIKCKQQRQMSVENIDVIFEDSDKCIWIGAEGNLGFFDQEGNYHYAQQEGFDGSFEKIIEDDQGDIWVASSRYGVMKLAESMFVDLFSKVGIEKMVVNAVVSFKGNLYCGTDKGLVILKEENDELVENELSQCLKGKRIRSLMVDSKERLWLCTYGEGGLICYDGERVVATYTVENGATSNRFRCITEMQDGTIAAGTSDGINLIKGGKVIGKITAEDGLLNSQILTLANGQDGKLYAGTDGGGLYVIANDHIEQQYTIQDGLTSDIILRIVPYQEGRFIITSNALLYMDESLHELEDFPYFNNYDLMVYEDKAFIASSAGIYEVKMEQLLGKGELRYRLYGVQKGLTSALTANAWHYIDPLGRIYLCCNNTVMLYTNQEDLIHGQIKYGITSVLGDGKPIAFEDNEIHIPASVRSVSLTASVRNYALSSIHVSFYVEGRESTAKRYAYDEIDDIFLTDLCGGEYKIHLQIMDVYEDKVLQEQVYTLVKKKQIWEHGWYILYLVVVCLEMIIFISGTIFMVIYNMYRKERLEKLKKEMEETIKEQTRQIRLQKEKTEQLYLQTVAALSETVDAKDHYTSGHSKRVAMYAKMIAKRMGKSEAEQEEIFRAGLLHDIGKIRVHEDVINKSTKLTEEEFALIKIHPVVGYHILKNISGDKHIAQAARFHHERYNGSGYPNGLKGDNIPEIARIIGVADAYDAMTSNRSYRKAVPQESVRKEIEEGKWQQFDPEVADIMLEMMDEDSDYRMKQIDEIKKFILVVADGMEKIQRITDILVEEQQYEVLGAVENEEIEHILDAHEVSLILLEQKMAQQVQYESVSKIKNYYDIPIIMITADKESDNLREIMSKQVDDYLTEPFLPLTLVEMIHSILSTDNTLRS